MEDVPDGLAGMGRSTQDLSETPVFCVATPKLITDLTKLTNLGAKLLVILSEQAADAALAYEYETLDFLRLPLAEARLWQCLNKLTHTIQQANNGYADVLPRLACLTAMQRMVLGRIGQQKTTRQIANELFISPKTVETHRTNIREILNFTSRRPLIPFAILALQRNLL